MQWAACPVLNIATACYALPSNPPRLHPPPPPPPPPTHPPPPPPHPHPPTPTPALAAAARNQKLAAVDRQRERAEVLVRRPDDVAFVQATVQAVKEWLQVRP